MGSESRKIDAQTIKNSPLGEELSEQQCASLAGVVGAIQLEKGVFLLEEGHQDEVLYVVVDGVLEVVRQTGGGDYVSLQLLRKNDMAGELGFVDGRSHSAGIRAISRADLFALDRAAFDAFVKTDPDLVYKVMRAIVRTVHAIVCRMNLQHIEMSNYISKQHGRY